MAGPSPVDPASLFREMLGQWEAMANEFGGNLMKSGEFTRVMHGANAANMKLKEARADMMERALDAANMPTKAEVADLSARLHRIESTVDRIEAMMAAQTGQSTIPNRPKPKRTRTAPEKPGAKTTSKATG
ncbi:MAG: hypothetical protein BVN32_08670 [Proteobacteria bacterium ST_bin14]|nr:MAG: hypothetical protein BVN32_08670 [Proteobacteria bacterium ST_bin14]